MDHFLAVTVTFDHAKTIIAIILSLSITHLIRGMVGFVESTKSSPRKPYWIHLMWCGYMLLLIIHFWWWEAELKNVSHWDFAKYLFLFLYINSFYVLCVLLMPTNLGEHKNYVEYFYSRKKWFFGTLAFCFLLDFIDTLIKGRDYFFHHYNWEYPVRNITHIILCIVAMYTHNRKFHAVLVWLFLLYELSYIFRLF